MVPSSPPPHHEGTAQRPSQRRTAVATPAAPDWGARGTGIQSRTCSGDCPWRGLRPAGSRVDKGWALGATRPYLSDRRGGGATAPPAHPSRKCPAPAEQLSSCRRGSSPGWALWWRRQRGGSCEPEPVPVPEFRCRRRPPPLLLLRSPGGAARCGGRCVRSGCGAAYERAAHVDVPVRLGAAERCCCRWCCTPTPCATFCPPPSWWALRPPTCWPGAPGACFPPCCPPVSTARWTTACTPFTRAWCSSSSRTTRACRWVGCGEQGRRLRPGVPSEPAAVGSVGSGLASRPALYLFSSCWGRKDAARLARPAAAMWGLMGGSGRRRQWQVQAVALPLGSGFARGSLVSQPLLLLWWCFSRSVGVVFILQVGKTEEMRHRSCSVSTWMAVSFAHLNTVACVAHL